MSMEIEGKIREFLEDKVGWKERTGHLISDYRLIENEVLDSMAIFETIAFLEDEFGIVVQDDDLIPDNFETIAAIAQLVEKSQSR
jgi:acyl carrier protein